MKYQLADLVNGPFGKVFNTLEAAEADLADCIKDAEEIEASLSEDELGADNIAPHDFFCIVNAETGEAI